MRAHVFETTQFLPINISSAWAFFSNPRNLARITPPKLRFRILTELDDREIYEGMIIDYTLRPLLGIPTHWQTEISHAKKPVRFVDRQAKGPYKLWEHTHNFTVQDNGVLMLDRVVYRLPLGWLGVAVNYCIVRRAIGRIFAYRRETLGRMLFPTSVPPGT